jgi:hypothetical protein
VEQTVEYNLPTAIFVRPGRSMRVRFTTATKRDCQMTWNRFPKILNMCGIGPKTGKVQLNEEDFMLRTTYSQLAIKYT